jgi:SAM-dependent methyltransferase
MLNIHSGGCPLCHAEDIQATYHRDSNRDYHLCSICHLVFVPPDQFLSPQQERDQYDLHQNSPDDQGYRKFLSRLFLPMQERLSPGSHGLDFGSGPGPTLSVMFQEVGHTMALYDYFYARDLSVFTHQYDFITATEVLEHLHHPPKELNRLWKLLKPGGTLGIMTKLTPTRESFPDWHYKNDPTHVCFYSPSTFKWLAARWDSNLMFVNQDVMLFIKKPLS